MERRQFLNWVGVGALAAYLPVAIAACSEDSNAEKATPKADAEGFVTIGTVAQLNEKGSILNDELEIIAFRNPETKEIVALNPVCPHKGCNVEWKAEEKILECPCHDSKFAIDGKVERGPAKKGLEVYETKEKEESILVKIA